jgi:NAD(P)-dependent dehydrogenase (short-subunit alcohol dehydrogenase family)
MGISGKRVVVIGGSSGIGFAVADLAAAAGAEVVIASSSQERLDRAVKLLPEQVSGHRLDVTDEAELRDFFAALGAYDHLVFTAGDPLRLTPIREVDVTAAKEFFQVRFWGAFAAVRYGAAGIRPGGSVVLTSGTASQRPGPGWPVAAAITGAAESLGRALAVELAPVRVNVVRPGPTRTPLWEGGGAPQAEELYRQLAAQSLAGRVGDAEEVARTYLHLLDNGFTTGTVVTVDGGHLLG